VEDPEKVREAFHTSVAESICDVEEYADPTKIVHTDGDMPTDGEPHDEGVMIPTTHWPMRNFILQSHIHQLY